MNKGKLPFEVKDDSIFLYLGHGEDFCNKEGELVIRTVPDNCIYITQTTCGIINRMEDTTFRKFSEEKYAHIWRNPIKYKDELKNLFGSHPNLHIHMPGSTYVDNIFYPVSDVDEKYLIRKNKYVMRYSGLLPLEKALTMSDEERNLFIQKEYQITKSTEQMAELLNESLPTEEMRSYFAKSIYPQFLNVKEERLPTLSMKRMGASRRILASTLMERYPGIHFNLLCRVVTDPRCKEAVRLRRRESATEQNTVLDTLHKMISIKNEHLTGDEIVEYIEDSQNDLLKRPDILIPFAQIATNSGFPSVSKALRKLHTILLEEFNTLLQKNDKKGLKEFIDRFDVESDFGESLLSLAFHSDSRPVVKYLCKKGAPSDMMVDEYLSMKKFRTRKTLKKKRFLLMDCKKARTR